MSLPTTCSKSLSLFEGRDLAKKGCIEEDGDSPGGRLHLNSNKKSSAWKLPETDGKVRKGSVSIREVFTADNADDS